MNLIFGLGRLLIAGIALALMVSFAIVLAISSKNALIRGINSEYLKFAGACLLVIVLSVYLLRNFLI